MVKLKIKKVSKYTPIPVGETREEIPTEQYSNLLRVSSIKWWWWWWWWWRVVSDWSTSTVFCNLVLTHLKSREHVSVVGDVSKYRNQWFFVLNTNKEEACRIMKRQKKCNGSTEGEELRRKKKESKRKKVKSFTNCWGRPGADNLFLGLRHMEAEQL